MERVDFDGDVNLNDFPIAYNPEKFDFIIASCDYKVKQTQIMRKGDIFKVDEEYCYRPRTNVKWFYIKKNNKQYKIHSSRFRIYPIYEYKIKTINNILEKI